MGGFFGVVSQSDSVSDLFYGTDYHSHLGTQRGGMAVLGAEGFRRFIHDIRNTQFRTKFSDDVHQLHGTSGIGVISDYEDQPLLIGSHLGPYALVTVGVVRNIDALARKAYRKRTTHFSEMRGGEINPTEMIATIINAEATFTEGLRRVQEEIEGSCSLLLLTREGIYAARDRWGRTPVILGEKAGAFAMTMESCAFPNLDYRPVRDLGPGEIVRVTPEGVEVMSPPRPDMKMCSFLWIYYGYPASSYEGQNVEMARNRCGQRLASREHMDIDMVAGVPDSGVAHGLGYAGAAGIPYRRPFVKYTPTWPRSFMPQNPVMRDLVARMKLIPIREMIDGARILFCDDSIVRGTQLKDTIRRLFDFGAKEVHMRAACPPLMYACPYLNFSRTKSEMDLAARRAIREIEGRDDVPLEPYTDPDSPRHAEMCRRICEKIGLTSLKYQRIEDMKEAIGLPPERLCTYCWNRQG
ncbi:MAG: amidophosphoribosyltransferase [Kiritimatiellae bacterium]|nr:amidophosphoribosyltransferase [Kiritimatiellia bacterium]